jgi:hypothetical protein
MKKNAVFLPLQCGLRCYFRNTKQNDIKFHKNYIRIHRKILLINTLYYWQHSILS